MDLIRGAIEKTEQERQPQDFPPVGFFQDRSTGPSRQKAESRIEAQMEQFIRDVRGNRGVGEGGEIEKESGIEKDREPVESAEPLKQLHRARLLEKVAEGKRLQVVMVFLLSLISWGQADPCIILDEGRLAV